MSQKMFDLTVVHQHFENSLIEEDDVELAHYLESYNELNKFFTLMGRVFAFVSKDLQSKTDLISALLANEPDKFRTAKCMINHEMNSNLLNTKGYISGSRTLLRLHRGLDFIRLFLKHVSELKNEENTGHVCRSAYNETLAKYHSFLIVRGAELAMYTMPTKGDLLKRVCGTDEENLKKAVEILPRTLETIATVYDRIEQLFFIHELHSLA